MIHADFDAQQTDRTLGRIHDRLRDSEALGELVNELFETVRPWLERGRHVAPVFHTPLVVELICASSRASGLSIDHLRALLVMGFFHDSGNDEEPPDEPKIRKADVDADPSKRDLAVLQRRRHAKRSAELARDFLSRRKLFAPEVEGRVLYGIEHHDDPTLAQLVPGSERRGFLFDPGQESRLLWLHRECDRLFMLHPLGILTDMVRARERGRTVLADEQLTMNVIRHFEERLVYEREFSDRIAEFRFGATTAFYRFPGGRELFATLQERTRSIGREEWTRLLRDAAGG